jgi:hypothetical protein
MGEAGGGGFQWIQIPPVAEPGQTRAFANRENQLAKLYMAVVAAGNAVVQGELDVRHRIVVSGYMGVGKSALILQTLGMVRDELGTPDGQLLRAPADLPDPDERHRWLLLRASGKHVPSVDAITDAIRTCALSVLDEVKEGIERRLPGVLELPVVSWAMRKRETVLFAEVKRALLSLVHMIDYVHAWHGASLKMRAQSGTHTEVGQSTNIEGDLLAELRRQRHEPSTPEAKAALKLATSYLQKRASSIQVDTEIERQQIIGPELVVEALNSLFAATDRARIPTILVLDDFDEFASNVGPSHEQRARVLAGVLGQFNRLRPTCLLIGLREEYMHEDIRRQYSLKVHVPPLTRDGAAGALKAWGAVQRQSLQPGVVETLREIGDVFLRPFAPEDPVAVPFRFLQLVAWVANYARGWRKVPPRELVLGFLRDEFAPEVVRALDKLSTMMPEEDIRRCCEVSPLESSPYTLSHGERRALMKAGLLRPALAGDPEDTTLLVDPLCAYLRLASTDAASAG